MSKLLQISTRCKIYARPGDIYTQIYDTSLKLPRTHIKAVLEWFRLNRDTRLRRRLLASYLTDKTADIRALTEQAGISDHYGLRDLEDELETVKEEIQTIINLQGEEPFEWCYIPSGALQYLLKGTRREVFIVTLLGALRGRNRRLQVFHIRQLKISFWFGIRKQAISRAICQMIDDGILIKIYTPIWLMRTRGARYIFSDNNYKKRLPTYEEYKEFEEEQILSAQARDEAMAASMENPLDSEKDTGGEYEKREYQEEWVSS